MATMIETDTTRKPAPGQPASGSRVAIEVRDLHKTYPGKKAVDGVSFAVLQGEIFGILGPNGAGKSTTLEIIEGLRQPDRAAGTLIKVDGLDVQNPREVAELRQRIGLQLQSSALFDELTVRENLAMLAMLYRTARPVADLLREYELEDKAKARLETLSGGQKQRVALAAAVVNDPALVFLDEPTTALDPQARRNVWERIRGLQQAGKTIIMTTHYMEEAALLCDRLAIMDGGKIVALGTPAQLIQQYASEQRIRCQFDPSGPALSLDEVGRLAGVTSVTANAGGFILQTSSLTVSMSALMLAADRSGAVVSEITTQAPTLEDVFINLTGNELRS